MKIKNKLIILLVLCSFFTGALHSQTVDTDFPYNLPLTSGDGLTTIPFSGKNTSNETVTLPLFTGKGMKIASEGVIGAFSGAYFNDLSFSTGKGFVIEFVYEFYSQTLSPLGIMGDGFALVLFDGSVSKPTIGSNGSGLGFAYNRISPTSKASQGLTGGFMGIGFDVFGAFKNQGFAQVSTEGASLGNDNRTGIYTIGMPAGFQGANDLRNFVTIRGKVNPITTYGANKAGYPVLFSQNTYNPSLTGGTLYNASLSTTWGVTGNTHPIYAYLYNPATMKSFTIAGGQENVSYPSLNYRKVRVEMIPDPSNSGIFYMNVLVTTNNAQNPIKVVNKFKYDNNASITYPEVLTTAANVSASTVPTSMSLKAPASLKLGWTASTGNAWANIVLKDASVTLPYSPVVTNDIAELCTRIASTVTVSPLDNDYGYGASPNPVNDPVPSKDNISKSSFRFMVPKGEGKVGYTPNSTAYEYKSTYATYTYNASTGIVTAKVTSTVPDGTVDNVYYDVTDNTRTGKEYRSKAATIAFTYKNSLCPAITIPNPEATNDVASLCNTTGSTTSIYPLANDKGYVLSSGTLVSGPEQLDKSSFTFTTASGVAATVTKTANDVTYSTARATYLYTYSTGKLVIKTSTAITNNTTEPVYYTVKNTGGTVASNVATITSTFSGVYCSEATKPVAANDVASLCNTSGSTTSLYPLSNDIGYIYNTSGVQLSGFGYVDKSSFIFTNATGVAATVTKTANTVTYSTAKASYVYTYLTGELVIKALTTTTGTSTDLAYYTVKNTGGTIASNVATITSTLKSCTSEPPTPVLISQLIDDICKTEGTSFTINPFLDATNSGDIDKSSFLFDQNSSSSSYNGTYANYTYNATTGLITGVVKANSITTEDYELIMYSVMATGGKLRSDSNATSIFFNTTNCSTTRSGWIKINGTLNRSTNNVFINGMGGLAPQQ